MFVKYPGTNGLIILIFPGVLCLQNKKYLVKVKVFQLFHALLCLASGLEVAASGALKAMVNIWLVLTC